MIPLKVWRLDADGRLSPRARGLKWRVIAADQGRVDPAAHYLFCAPDFLFPVDSRARALRLEVDARPILARKTYAPSTPPPAPHAMAWTRFPKR